MRAVGKVANLFTAVVVAWFLTTAGCSGRVSDSGAGGNPPGGGPAPGPGGPPITEPSCQIQLMAASPLSFEGLSAGPDATLKVRGIVTGVPAATYRWDWRVLMADGTAVPFSQPSPEENLIQFSLPSPGTYTIIAQLSGAKYCRGERTAVVARTGARLRSFRFHVTPPPGAELPTQDFEVQVIGGTPSGGNYLQLLPGIEIPMKILLAETGAAARAYVRISNENGIVFEAQSGRNPAGLLPLRLPPGVYETLIVPEGDVAPLLIPPTPATTLQGMMGQPLMLDAGMPVEGMVLDVDGSPLPNSKVILRAGALTSTLGTSDATGAFRVRVRPGQFSGTVSPPVALGMMRAEFPVAMGVTIPPNPAPAPVGSPTGGTASPAATAPPAPALGFRLLPFRSSRLILALSGAPDSLGPAARVVLESMAPIADVATLSVGNSNHTVTARIHGELVPNADGTVVASTLPRGRYKATIYPAGGADAADAVTTVTDIDVGPGDVVTRKITLARKVTLSGKLLPGDTAAGIDIVALDLESLLPLAFVKQVTAGGGWEMAVNPARTYTLRALPQPGQRFARASLGRVSVAATDLSMAARNMPDALPYTGTILGSSPGGMEGALLQIFCLPGTPDCSDETVPVAETVTGLGGTFALMLPDPGVAPP